jgi:hypothetical protein
MLRLDGVGRHADLEAAQVGVQRRVEDALLRDLAAEDDPAHLLRVEEVADRSLVEDRMAALDQERRVVGRHERLDQLGVAARQRAPHELGAAGLPGLVVVVDVDGQRLVARALEQGGDPRDGLARRGGQRLGVVVVVVVEHVDDEERGARHAASMGENARMRGAV